MSTNMYKAWLVTNEFLSTDKFNEINKWLLVGAGKNGIALEIKTNAECMAKIHEDIKDKPDFVVFWDKDIRLAKYLEGQGLRLFNSADSIALCDDKAMTHITLANSGIKMPKTIIAPFTYNNIGYTNLEFVKEAEEQLGYPMVIKECFGSFGAQVYLANNHEETLEIIKKIDGRPFLFQEFMFAYAGSDLRLQVVGDKVVASMLRYSVNGDFRANITNGGKMEKYAPSEEQVEMAVKAAKLLGLEFAGVDLLFGNSEEPVLCEVNSNAHFKNIHDCTGVNAADCIFTHIRNILRQE